MPKERRIMLGDKIGGGITESGYLSFIPFDDGTLSDYFHYNESYSMTGRIEQGKYSRCLYRSSRSYTDYPSTSLLSQYFQYEIGGGAGDYSVDFWVHAIGSFRLNITFGPEVYLQGSNLIDLQVGDSHYLEIQSSQIDDNEWHHIACQFFEYAPSSYTVRNYLDGKTIGEASNIPILPNTQGATQRISFVNTGISIDQYRIMKGINFNGDYDSVEQMLENFPYPDQIG